MDIRITKVHNGFIISDENSSTDDDALVVEIDPTATLDEKVAMDIGIAVLTLIKGGPHV